MARTVDFGRAKGPPTKTVTPIKTNQNVQIQAEFLEQEAKELDQKFQNFKAEKEAFLEENTSLKLQLKENEKSKGREIKDLKDKIQLLEQEKQEWQTRDGDTGNDEFKQRLALEKQTLETRCMDMQHRLNLALESKKKMSQQINDLVAQNQALQQGALANLPNVATAAIHILQQQLHEMQSTYAQLHTTSTNALEQQEFELAQLRASNLQKSAANEQLRKREDALKINMESVKAKSNTVNSELVRTAKENKELKEEVEALRARVGNNALAKEVESLREENERLSSGLSRAENRIEKQRLQIDKQKRALKEWEKQGEEAVRVARKLKEDKDDLLVKVDSLQKEMQSLTSKAGDFGDENESLHTAYRDQPVSTPSDSEDEAYTDDESVDENTEPRRSRSQRHKSPQEATTTNKEGCCEAMKKRRLSLGNVAGDSLALMFGPTSEESTPPSKRSRRNQRITIESPTSSPYR